MKEMFILKYFEEKHKKKPKIQYTWKIVAFIDISETKYFYKCLFFFLLIPSLVLIFLLLVLTSADHGSRRN